MTTIVDNVNFKSASLKVDAAGNLLITSGPAVGGGVSRLAVEPLGQPGVSRQLTAGAASTNQVLTSTCRRISMRAVGADIRYLVGSTALTASATTSHIIFNGERLDIALPATPNIAFIRAGSTNGTLEVSELL